MSRVAAIWMLSLLAGCSSLEKRLSSTSDKALLFPPGVYTHQVEIETAEQKKYNFRVLVKISTEKVLVIGLSPFQTTIFRIENNRKTGEIKTEIFQDTLEKHKDSLLDFYSMLTLFLTLPKNGENPKVKVYAKNSAGSVTEIGVRLRDKEVKVRLLHFDGNDIADDMELEHPNFKVRVKVVGYEA